MGVGEAFISLFQDDFKVGVEDTAKGPLIYIEPNSFDAQKIMSGLNNLTVEQAMKIIDDPAKLREHLNIDDADVQRMRDMLNEQRPGLGDSLNLDETKMLIVRAAQNGPHAQAMMHEDQKVFIINKPGNAYDEKADIARNMSGFNTEFLGTVPGWEYLWERAQGIHEGAHTNQAELENFSSLSPQEQKLHIFSREVDSDRHVVKWLNDNGHADIAQAWTDYRALGAVFDSEHPTAPFLSGDPQLQPTMRHLEAAQTFGQTMFEAVGKELNISSMDVQKALQTDPGQYDDARTVIGALDTMLARGDFDNQENPHVKEYIQAYVDAYKRQILDEFQPVSPQNAPSGELRTTESSMNTDQPVKLIDVNGGAAKVTLGEGDSASMTIGEVSASQFFASHAHPALAAERIALSETLSADPSETRPEQAVNAGMAVT